MKSDLKNFLVDADCSIRTVATKLELHGLGAAFAIKNKVLVGVITDSDLRRLLLKEVPLDSPLHNHLNNDYLAVKSDESILKYRDIINKKGIEIIPVVNSAGNLVDIINVNETNNHRHQNTIIVMAGGLGSRMGAMTNKCPKPMLEVAGKPIICRLIEKCVEQGFTNFVISVNYLSEVIINFLRDGSQFGCNIEYQHENEKLGTAGGLSCIKLKPNRPVIVVNGDIITSLKFSNLLKYHLTMHSDATMCLHSYELSVPYGVVDLKGNKITGIIEKPTFSYNTNAGIYCLSPEVINYIPKNCYYDMTSLFSLLIGKNKKVCGFKFDAEWMDVGSPNDLQNATVKLND